jgi:hypothetical protein
MHWQSQWHTAHTPQISFTAGSDIEVLRSQVLVSEGIPNNLVNERIMDGAPFDWPE